MLEALNNAVSAVTKVKTQSGDERSKEFFKKLEDVGVNVEELHDIFECRGNALIASGAGSGKTTALVLKILHDHYCGYCDKVVEIPSAAGNNFVRVPSNILVTTFLKSGAEDLRRSFYEWAERLNIGGLDNTKLVFKTIHAEVYDALKSMTGTKPEIVADGQKYIRNAMKTFGIRSVLSRSRTITLEEVRDIECILAYARNRLDAKKYNHPLMSDYKIDQVILDGILKDTKMQRQLEQVVDFEDLQELLLDALKKYPNVRQNIKGRYDYIYCDEFQDTSQLQYAILQYYIAGVKRVIAIGDDDQCIYSWRGSDINIITHYFIEDYKPEIFKLTTNYRCKSNILNAVIPSITKNVNRVDKSLRSYKEGGELNVLINHSVDELITRVKADVREGNTVGILSRTNNDLLIPALILELGGGIDFSISKQLNIRARLPRFVFGCIELVTKRYTDNFEDYFKQVLSFYNKEQASILASVLQNNKDKSIFNIPEEDFENAVLDLFDTLIKPLREAYNSAQGEKGAYKVLLWIMRDTFTGSSPYAKKARELFSYVIQLIDSDMCRDMTLFEFDNLLNDVIPMCLSKRVDKASARVKLTTVHEAKGKEWDSVYIWNDNDGVFPAQVGQRQITADEYEEERRIHYIAWTRAKDKLTVFANDGNISPFLEECDCSFDSADSIVERHFVLGG